MHPPPRVSAVISSYNRPDFLRRSLLSYATQTHPVDEVVITDDGSSVDVPSGIADVLAELPFPVLFVRQPHQVFRLAKCRNNGIREARGDYLIFSDQDIVLFPSYVERFMARARPREFLVGNFERLDEVATARMTDDLIRARRLETLVSTAGQREVRQQYRKDLWYRLEHALGVRKIATKLRGGVFGAWRADLVAVNGLDEEYRGWGAEDDDLGRRLHRAGVVGRNVFRDVLALHLLHPPNRSQGERPNQEYYARRVREINAGAFRADHGLQDPLGGDESTRLLLHDPGA
jgi:glycosyltransferase involved in cell wall biosynthesis